MAISLVYSEIFRFCGDLLLVSSRGVLINKIIQTQSVSGLSLQTQFIYLVAYIFRYLDLFSLSGKFPIKRIYNTIMKVVFLSYQVCIIFLIIGKYKNTYNKRYDNFNLPVIFGSCFALSFVLKGETFSFGNYIEEYLYTCSLLLEAVAILPQLVMIQEAGDCESMTSIFIAFLGLYRLCYVVYFILKWLAGSSIDLLLLITGVVQTALYLDFFAVYYNYVVKNSKQLLERSTRRL